MRASLVSASARHMALFAELKRSGLKQLEPTFAETRQGHRQVFRLKADAVDKHAEDKQKYALRPFFERSLWLLAGFWTRTWRSRPP